MRERRDFIFSLRELSGGLGDLGTLLPLTLACIVAAGLSPAAVLGAFGLFYLATALAYRLPVPVQPMKAVVAVVLTAQVAPSALASGGMLLGAVLLVLGVTGWIGRLARLIPQSVLAGLQVGLGLALASLAVGWILTAPLLGLAVLAVLAGLLALPGWPAALIALAAAVCLGQALGAPAMPLLAEGPTLAWPAAPEWRDLEQALGQLVLPQLSLTLTNAVILTALVAKDYFGDAAAAVTPRRRAAHAGGDPAGPRPPARRPGLGRGRRRSPGGARRAAADRGDRTGLAAPPVRQPAFLLAGHRRRRGRDALAGPLLGSGGRLPRGSRPSRPAAPAPDRRSLLIPYSAAWA